MNRFRTAAWLFSALLVSCRSDDVAAPRHTDTNEVDKKYELPLPVPAGHDDVIIKADLEGDEVVIKWTAMSGGYAFSRRGVETKDGAVDVRIRLTHPGRGEATSDALENLRIAVPVPTGKQPVRVLLQQVLRGARYRTEPPFVVKHTLTR